MYSANTIVYTAGALAFMISISPWLTLLYVSAAACGKRRDPDFRPCCIHDRFERIQAMFSDISARAQEENFSGARLIRAYVQEEAEIRLFEAENQEYIRRSLRLVRLMGMLWPTLELMLGCAVVLVLWLGGREVIHGLSHVSLVSNLGLSHPGVSLPATITTSLSLSGSMSAWPIRLIQHLHDAAHLADHCSGLGYQHLSARDRTSLIRINEIMHEQPEIQDAAGSQDRQIAGEIEFRGLNFSYEGKQVLHDVNLRVPAGSSLAIGIGPTGSGKTTLVSLIPRIYDAEPGMVLIDGRPIRDYLVSTLRKNIGFVPQETFLFSDRIRENIALGVDCATDQEIHNAADAANIAADIESFSRRLRHHGRRAGHHALRRPGSSARRLPRALIRNPKILDSRRRAVQRRHPHRRQNPQPPAGWSAAWTHDDIFISHRVSTVRNADRIAVLNGGRIVELGTHDELLALERLLLRPV